MSAACHLCMDMLSSPHTFPKGMMGAYGPPYMSMQGPHEGLLSVAPMPPHPTGGPHLPPHHLQQGMPGYPGMPHQGKGHCPSRTCSVTSSRVSPAGGGLPGPQAAKPDLHTEQSKQSLLKCSHISHLKYTNKYMKFTHGMHAKLIPNH